MRKLSCILAAAILSLFSSGAASIQGNTTGVLPHGTDKGKVSEVDTTVHTFTLM